MKTTVTSAMVNLPTTRPPSRLPLCNCAYQPIANRNLRITSLTNLNLSTSTNSIRFSSTITYCEASTVSTSPPVDEVSPSQKELPPTLKKKRKVYRRMRPGESIGITEEMRFVAMKLRDKKLKVKADKVDANSNRSKEDSSSDGEINGSDEDDDNDADDESEIDDANSDYQVWEPEIEGLMRFLVESRFLFSSIERMVDESQDVSFAYFRNTGLERSESFTKDIELLTQYNLSIPEPQFTSKKYVKYLEDLAAENPPLFFCHLYNIYFSHIAGGQVIARKVSEKLLEGRELEICKWPGDPEELLKGMRDKLNALGQHWTRDEKNKCLKEASKCFTYMGMIIRVIIMA